MRTTIALCSGLLSFTAFTQNCPYDYVTRQFDVSVESGVLYGTAPRFDGGTDSLRMNIYKPVGDGVAQRPLFVAVHGGAFLGGHRNDMNELCQWYAERGYVAATISYRLGFYSPALLPNPYAYDQAEVVRAAYRAQQDVKGAIRFLRARQAQDSTHAENVFVCGVSAGGITAMHVAYATANEERPAACAAIGTVDLIGQQIQRPDLGPIDGELNLGESAGVKACVSYFGGLLDTTMIDANTDPALFMYHQTGDPVVGCGYQQGLWGMPLGVGGNYPWLYGSCAIDPHVQQLGFTSERYEFHPYTGNQHDIHDIPVVDGWSAIFLARQFCSTGTFTEEVGTQRQVHVYPNPATDVVRTTRNGNVRLRLLDLDGRLVRSATGTEMSVLDLAAGTYVLEVEGDGGRSIHRIAVAH